MQEIRCFDRVYCEAIGFKGTVVRIRGNCWGVGCWVLPDPGEKVPHDKLNRYGCVERAFTGLSFLSRPRKPKKKQLQAA